MKTVILSSLLITMNMAFAGNESGGGGGAVVCFDGEKIVSAKLLDLYEGESIFGDTFAEVQTYQEAMNVGLERLSKTAFGMKTGYSKARSVADLVKHVEQKKRFISRTVELKPINDSFELFVPRNCQIKQAVAFMSDETILFDQNIWDNLSGRDKAGLVLHEAVYWYSRMTSTSYDSRRSRRVVSLSLSADWKFEDVQKGIPDNAITCQSQHPPEERDTYKVTAFKVYALNDKWSVVQWLFLNGDPVLSKKTSALHLFPTLDRSPTDLTSYSMSDTTDSLFEADDKVTLHSSPNHENQNYSVAIGSRVSMSEGIKGAYPFGTIKAVKFHCSR